MLKRTILTLVAVAMLSQAGCCRGWPRWFTRGDSCSTSYGGCGYEGGGEFQGQGGTLLPPNVIMPQNQILPGPASQQG